MPEDPFKARGADRPPRPEDANLPRRPSAAQSFNRRPTQDERSRSPHGRRDVVYRTRDPDNDGRRSSKQISSPNRLPEPQESQATSAGSLFEFLITLGDSLLKKGSIQQKLEKEQNVFDHHKRDFERNQSRTNPYAPAFALYQGHQMQFDMARKHLMQQLSVVDAEIQKKSEAVAAAQQASAPSEVIEKRITSLESRSVEAGNDKVYLTEKVKTLEKQVETAAQKQQEEQAAKFAKLEDQMRSFLRIQQNGRAELDELRDTNEGLRRDLQARNDKLIALELQIGKLQDQFSKSEAVRVKAEEEAKVLSNRINAMKTAPVASTTLDEQTRTLFTDLTKWRDDVSQTLQALRESKLDQAALQAIDEDIRGRLQGTTEVVAKIVDDGMDKINVLDEKVNKIQATPAVQSADVGERLDSLDKRYDELMRTLGMLSSRIDEFNTTDFARHLIGQMEKFYESPPQFHARLATYEQRIRAMEDILKQAYGLQTGNAQVENPGFSQQHMVPGQFPGGNAMYAKQGMQNGGR